MRPGVCTETSLSPADRRQRGARGTPGLYPPDVIGSPPPAVTAKNASRHCHRTAPTPSRPSRFTSGQTAPHRGKGLPESCTDPRQPAEAWPASHTRSHTAKPWPPNTPDGAQTHSRWKRAERALERTVHLGDSQGPGPGGPHSRPTVSSCVYAYPKPLSRAAREEARLWQPRAHPQSLPEPWTGESGVSSGEHTHGTGVANG